MAAKIKRYADELDIEIKKGTTFQVPFTWTDENGLPIDITGWEVRMQVRSEQAATTTLLDISTVSGEITLSDPTNGEFTITLSDTVTSAFSWVVGVYDIELESPGGVVYELLYGTVETIGEVTR